jgi:hypothetical protein
MVGILGDDHMGDQGFGRQTAFDQARRCRCLDHGPRAVAAGIFRPADHQHAELLRNHIEPLRNILANGVKRAAAAGATPVIDIDHHIDPRQVLGQRSAVDLAPARWAWAGYRLFFSSLGRGNALLEVLQAERQLIGIELLRAAAEAMALQGDDNRAQPIALALGPCQICRVLSAFDNKQRAQRCWIGRQIVGVGRHAFGVPRQLWRAKPSDAPESICRRLLRRLRRPNLDLSNPRPIETLDQGRELRWRQPHDTVLDLRPAERALLEPLGEQAKASSIPEDQLHPVSALGAEHKDRTRIGIGAQMFLHHRRQPVHALTEVNRSGRNQHPGAARYRDHTDLNASRTARSVRSSSRPRTVTRMPVGKTISIAPPCFVGVAAAFGFSRISATTTGTRSGNAEAPSLVISRSASRRHV